MNYKLRIQCFKVTPHQTEEGKYINFERIIPVKDIEEYVTSMADKSQSGILTQNEEKNRHRLRLEFWGKYISESNKRIDLCRNVSPSKSNWITGASGITGAGLVSSVSRSSARVEVYISRPNTDENKFIFDHLAKGKDQI